MDTENTKSSQKETVAATGGHGIALKTENLVSVQEYTGEGYALRNGEETDKIAEANRDEIEVAVKKFFSEKYKTEVIVHNFVGAVDGVSVFVESVGEPHFHTFAVVPIDLQSKTVKTDSVWSQEGQIENALSGGLFAMAYDEEIANLNNFMNQITKEYPVVGKTKEAVEKTDSGYSTPYYYMSFFTDVFDHLNSMYLENQNVSKEELRNFLDENKFETEAVKITINLFMKEKDVEPDKVTYSQIVSEIESMDGLPRGAYTLLLHDNLINSKYGNGSKDNSIEETTINEIMKE
ncbi:DUF1672 family protein [Bacillus sp. FJAT-22090]|uniref:DUF1672 family protein n=1 Tax=Bacillus sp. FJAT-22090 TaxID=1581038 RepID=UPI0018D0F32A|nr:DUF1672 family protein [Bacillus sp. FJAT-22090]